MAYDFKQEAMAFTNELYYRNEPEPQDIRRADLGYVTETFERALRAAYAAGRSDSRKYRNL